MSFWSCSQSVLTARSALISLIIVVVTIIVIVEARRKMPLFQTHWLLVNNLLLYDLFDTLETLHGLPRISRMFY